MTIVHDLLNVLVGALILGAGLPALFALGVRWAHNSDSSPSQGLRKVGSWICFILIALVLALGILLITEAVIYQEFGLDLFGQHTKG